MLVMCALDAGPIAMQLHLLQLNSSSRSAHDNSQQCNIFCSPATEADRMIKSSAYIIAPMKQPLILQPLLHCLRLDKNLLINRLKRLGEMELPCRTPLPTGRLLEQTFFHLMTTLSLEYQLTNNTITHFGTADLTRAENNLK